MLLDRIFKANRQKSVRAQAKAQYSRLSAADLADMGIKRYQLEDFMRG